MSTRAQVADITDSSRSSRASSSADGSSCDDSSSTSSTRANQKDVLEHQRKRPKRRARFVHSDSLSSKLYCSSTSSSNEDEDSKEGEKDERRRVRAHHRPALHAITPAIDSDSSSSRSKNASPPQEISLASTKGEAKQTRFANVSNEQQTSTTSSNQSSEERKGEQEVSDPLGLLSQSELIAAAAALSAAATPESRRRRHAPGMTKKQLHQERLAANRRSAHDARIRREIMVDELQQSVVELVKENAALRKRRTELRNEVIQLHEANEKLKLRHQQRKRMSDGASAVNNSSQNPPPPPPAPPPPCNTPQAFSVGNSANASTMAAMDYQTTTSEGPSTLPTAAAPANGPLHGNSHQQMMTQLPNPFAQQQPFQPQTFQQQFYQNQQLLLQQQFNALNAPSVAATTAPYANPFPATNMPFPFLFTNSLTGAASSSGATNNVVPSTLDATTALTFHRAQQLQNLRSVQDHQQQGQMMQQQDQMVQQQNQLTQQQGQMMQQQDQMVQQQNQLTQQQGQMEHQHQHFQQEEK